MGKRFFCILLLTGVLLTGCGEKVPEKVPEQEEYVHVSLFMGVDFWHEPEWDVAEGTITGDISRKTGLAVDVMPRLEDPNRQLSLMLVNNDLPDVISVTDQTVISQLVTSGKVWDLEEFLKTYRPDSHILKEFPEDIKYELKKRDGGWYAWPSHINSRDARKIWPASAPCYQEAAEYGENKCIMWNRSLLKLLGLDAEELKTEEQVLEAFAKAKKNPELIPLLIDGDSWQEHTLAFLQGTFGAEYVDDDGNYTDVILQPETKDALRFLNTAMQKGYMDAEQMTMSNDQVKETLAGGKVLCFVGNMANTSADMREWTSSGAIWSSSGKTPVLGKQQQASTGWINTFISRDCRYPEQIAAWFDYMTGEEGMLRWCYGDEGVHYTFDEKGRIRLTEAGNAARAEYADGGIEAWWMFVNTAWERSVLAPYEDGSTAEAEAELQTAYAKDERTVIYNRSLTDNLLRSLPEGNMYEDMEKELEQWKKTQLSKVILASDDDRFEQEYQILLDGLAERNIQSLDAVKDMLYRERCREYGETIEKINRTGE